ncbi:MAG: L-histidine N(alpha)-methyltransferase [Nocardioidaceae bacterium]|nr:L-histidine N(alpha)-methyltransferase [Nocardioidaceae bacterium]
MRAPQIEVLLDSDWAQSSLIADVRRGLGSRPLTLPPRWLYDDHGSQLFDQITKLDVYYPFTAERTILELHAEEIVAASGATSLIELGSGTSEKTRLLLDAFANTGQLERFAPVDVSEQTLREAAAAIAQRYPSVDVVAVVGDFTLHLAHLPQGGRRMVAFLGGTIGNLYREERGAFLGALADVLEPGDSLLLGTELGKSPERLLAAYPDEAGSTAAFIGNTLTVLNRELSADFDPHAFAYIPFWDPHMQRIDMRLRAQSPQRVQIPGADLELNLATGEEIRVEISTKFQIQGIADELEAVGLQVARTWTDLQEDFALTLAMRG